MKSITHFVDNGERRSGRTTRLVDEFIQTLFTKGETEYYDHHPTDDMQEYILAKIKNRLWNEHDIGSAKLLVDKKTHTIKLI